MFMYNITRNPQEVTPFVAGGIYLANPTSFSRILEAVPKDALHQCGSFNARPVLLVKPPQPWDFYNTVTVAPASTRNIETFDVQGGLDGSTINFKLHELKTIHVSGLYRYIGKLSNIDQRLVSLYITAIYALNDGNVNWLLNNLVAMKRRYPVRAKEIQALINYVYNYNPMVVSDSNVDAGEFNVTDSQSTVHIRGFNVCWGRDMIPDDFDLDPADLRPRDNDDVEPEVRDRYILDTQTIIKHEPDITRPQPIKVSRPTTYVPIDAMSRPSTEATNMVDNNRTLVETFLVSSESRPWNKVPVEPANLITEDNVYKLYSVRRYNRDMFSEMAKSFLKKHSIFTKASPYHKAVENGTQDPWELDDAAYDLFRSWYESRTFETLPKAKLEAIFLNTARYIIPGGEREKPEMDIVDPYIRKVYDSLTYSEAVEVIPSISAKSLQLDFSVIPPRCAIVKELCVSARSKIIAEMKSETKAAKIITNAIAPAASKFDIQKPAAVPKASKTTQDKAEATIKAPKADKAKAPKVSKSSRDVTSRIGKIRLYLSPGGMSMIPGHLMGIFRSIDKSDIKDYCKNLPGWDKEMINFDKIYNEAILK